MGKASVPVDVFNPGQVFASLGFLEAADVLRGPARGGFAWDDATEARFVLETPGEDNPFQLVLEFLTAADIYEIVPVGGGDGMTEGALDHTFPTGSPQKSSYPIRFQLGDVGFDVTHWSDGSSRHRFKLYSGNRTALQIAMGMVHGVRARPRKNQSEGDLLHAGMKTLWEDHGQEMLADPFNVTTSMGGSFNFDPRGAWSALDAGYSPNDQKHGVEASPVVEMLAPIGMEYARPNEPGGRRVTYAIWRGPARPMLARPALAGATVGLALRKFEFALGESGRNRIVTFAQEVAAS